MLCRRRRTALAGAGDRVADGVESIHDVQQRQRVRVTGIRARPGVSMPTGWSASCTLIAIRRGAALTMSATERKPAKKVRLRSVAPACLAERRALENRSTLWKSTLAGGAGLPAQPLQQPVPEGPGRLQSVPG